MAEGQQGLTPQPHIPPQVEGGESVQMAVLAKYGVVLEENRYAVSSRTRFGLVHESAHFYPQGYVYGTGLTISSAASLIGWDHLQNAIMHWPEISLSASLFSGDFMNNASYHTALSKVLAEFYDTDIRRQRQAGRNIRLSEYALINPQVSVPLYLQLLGTTIGIANWISQFSRCGAVNDIMSDFIIEWDEGRINERLGWLKDRLRGFNIPAFFGGPVSQHFGVELNGDQMVWVRSTDFAYGYNYATPASAPASSTRMIDPQNIINAIMGSSARVSMAAINVDTQDGAVVEVPDLAGTVNGKPKVAADGRSILSASTLNALIDECHRVLNALEGEAFRSAPDAQTYNSYLWDFYRLTDAFAAKGFPCACDFLVDNPRAGNMFEILMNQFPQELVLNDPGYPLVNLTAHPRILFPAPFSPKVDSSDEDDNIGRNDVVMDWRAEYPMYYSAEVLGNEGLMHMALRGMAGQYYCSQNQRDGNSATVQSVSFGHFLPTSFVRGVRPGTNGKINMSSSGMRNVYHGRQLVAFDLAEPRKPLCFMSQIRNDGKVYLDSPMLHNQWYRAVAAVYQTGVVDVLGNSDDDGPSDARYWSNLVDTRSKLKAPVDSPSKIVAVDLSHIFQFPRTNIAGAYNRNESRGKK